MLQRIFATSLLCLLMSSSLGAQELPRLVTPDFTLGIVDKNVAPLRNKPAPGSQVKIKNLTQVIGEEPIRMSGFGVVSGLNGTGDSSDAALKLLIKVADRQGIRIDLADIEAGNVALVSLDAIVDPNRRTFDVAVMSVSDCDSLQNGYLEPSSLSPVGTDEVFAIASGPLALGARYFAAGGDAPGEGTASVTIGHPTMATVLDGGELVRDLPSTRLVDGLIELFVESPNNRNATSIADVINHYMGAGGIYAEPINASTVTVRVPKGFYGKRGAITRLLADIGELSVGVDLRALITIDQGSGVIAMTEGVKMEPGSIAVAGLTVTVSSDITPVTRQGFIGGETSFVDIPELQVSEEQANFLTLPAGTDLRKVQETLNALNLKPTSIISVFNALHRAGMIHADIVVLP